MKVKNNLNMTQRRMLEKIYRIEFNRRESDILRQRSMKREELKETIVTSTSEGGKVKGVLTLANAAYDRLEKLRDDLKSKGLAISGLDRRPQLVLAGYNQHMHPRIIKFDEETEKLRSKLNSKLTEMQAKIYGMELNYDDMRKEIDGLLKSI